MHHKLALMTPVKSLLTLEILCAKVPRAHAHKHSRSRISLNHSTRLAAVCRADS
jgi:hypothetical protein